MDVSDGCMVENMNTGMEEKRLGTWRNQTKWKLLTARWKHLALVVVILKDT